MEALIRPRVRAGVPVVDGGFVLDAGVTAVPGALGDLAHHVAGVVLGAGAAVVGDEAGAPLIALEDGLHEVVADADGEVGVLEHDGRVGFAVEVGFVLAALDEGAGLAFLFGLGLDEVHDVGMPVLERLHLGGAAGLAAGLHDGGDLVVDAHEGEGAGGRAAAGEFFAGAADRRQVGAGAGAVFEEHGLAGGEAHDVFHVVFDGLDKAGGGLGVLVGGFGAVDGAGLDVPVVVALGALDAVLVVEADVEPDGGVEGAVLVEAEPGELAVVGLGVFVGGEIAVVAAPVGDGAGDAVDDLSDAASRVRRSPTSP